MAITKEEAWTDRGHRPGRVPDVSAELIERVAFAARVDRRVDKRSGVSQRLPITLLENVVSSAERRAVLTGENEIVPRVVDVYAALPAITGKLELEYEGELVGGATIGRELIRKAADETFDERAGGANVDEIVIWFDEGGALQAADGPKVAAVLQGFEIVPDLTALVHPVRLAP